MTTYFTSDTHFNHSKIIEFCNRPARDRDEMNEMLIDRWNERVKPGDMIYHMGDFAFCGKTLRKIIINQLNGRKFLVRGNHDPDSNQWWLDAGFEWVRDYYKLKETISYEDDEGETKQYVQPIVLCHFPILSWDNMAHGSWHLHGHCHGSLPMSRMMRLDVGVDTNNWYPYSLEEIQKIMVMRSVVPVDHHGAD